MLSKEEQARLLRDESRQEQGPVSHTQGLGFLLSMTWSPPHPENGTITILFLETMSHVAQAGHKFDTQSRITSAPLKC